MSGPDVPSVKYVDALQANNLGSNDSVLHYEDLGEVVTGYLADNGRRQSIFYNQESGTMEELVAARQLAFAYWLATAGRVITSGPHNRDVWADRYTNASVELFGAPDEKEATVEVIRQKSVFENCHSDPNVDAGKLDLVLTEYAKVIDTATQLPSSEVERKNESDFEQAVQALRGEIDRRFGQVFEMVDRTGKDSFKQEDLVTVFADALQVLAETNDQDWGEWTVVCPEKGAAISVDGKNRQIKIPRKRGLADITEVKKLIGHELLTHGLRAKNARKSSDERLLKGYPGFLDGEEPLAIIMGAAASDGEVSDTIHDRYIDVAFAMGTIGVAPKKRHELFDLAYARRLVRKQHAGEIVDEESLEASAAQYVDRIYRGSPGDDIGTRQAVYTADIYYYRYKQIASYIAAKLQKGESAQHLFDYLMQGKFDPTNSQHIERVKKLNDESIARFE